MYSTVEMIYSFSDSVGSAGGLSFDNTGGNGLATMQTYVTTVAQAALADATIQGLIGTDWTPVWGPIVYAENTGGKTVIADNTMGCYYSPSNKLFVIAIAGTNPLSPFDWLDEDVDVHTLVSWTAAGGSGDGNISTGANTGLQTLLGLKDGNGDTMLSALASYIEAGSITGATIAVTGHSLGGALSPCMALYLHDNLSALGLDGQSIAAYPTAGPTPGDKDFAQTYEAVIAAGGITYASVYNALDVIPSAWEEDLLATIPTIYDANIKPASTDSPADDFMGIATCGLQLNALAKTLFSVPYNPYTQISTNRNALAGTFDSTVDGEVQSKLKYVSLVLPSGLQAYVSTLTNVARFAAQAAAQHTIAYPALLGISAFDAEYQQILAAHKPSTATMIDPIRASVRKLAGIDLDLVEAAGVAAAKQVATQG